jgi:hypothetical protein
MEHLFALDCHEKNHNKVGLNRTHALPDLIHDMGEIMMYGGHTKIIDQNLTLGLNYF